MNWLGLGLGFRKVAHVPMLAVPDIRLTPPTPPPEQSRAV